MIWRVKKRCCFSCLILTVMKGKQAVVLLGGGFLLFSKNDGRRATKTFQVLMLWTANRLADDNFLVLWLLETLGVEEG